MAEPLDVSAALAEAAGRLHAALSLDQTLRAVVAVARDSMPCIDHAGVTVATADPLGHDGADVIETTAATDDVVLDLDRLQYRLGEGPCLGRLTHAGPMVVVDHVATPDRTTGQGADDAETWPRFLPEAARRGLRSMVAVRLFADEGEVAVLNLYSTSADVVDAETRTLAPLFATHVAVAYGHNQQVENLRRALDSREVIGQAVGIVMERYGLDTSRAFGYLVRVSATSETKLRHVAAAVVGDAGGREG